MLLGLFACKASCCGLLCRWILLQFILGADSSWSVYQSCTMMASSTKKETLVNQGFQRYDRRRGRWF